MLEDRHYMRRPAFGGRPSATVVLLAVNIAAFILQNILARVSSFPLDDYCALSVAGLRHGYVWQLLTFQFMHGGWLHLLLNCWAIYVFGRQLEQSLGVKTFLTLYFSSGVVGGLFQGLAGVILGGTFLMPVVGASAGVFGLVSAFAMLYPEQPLTMLLFFIIPIQMRAKFLLIGSAVLAVLGIALQKDNIAHAAHLGGMIAGIVFVKHAIHWKFELPRFRRTRPASPLRRPVKILSRSSASWDRGIPQQEELAPDEFLSREVDPILDKISAHGIQSLTERERRILETARKKMGKR